MKEERQENEEPELAGETPSTVPCTDRWEVRILLVDDEEVVMRKTAAALERLGYAVAGATDGQAAQRLLAEAPEAYDLLITDVTCPGWTDGNWPAAPDRLVFADRSS